MCWNRIVFLFFSFSPLCVLFCLSGCGFLSFLPHIVLRSWGQSRLPLPDGQCCASRGIPSCIAGWHMFPVSAAASLSDSCRECWYFITSHVSYLWETRRALRIFCRYLIFSLLSEVGSRKCYLHFADVTAEAKPNLMKAPQQIKARRVFQPPFQRSWCQMTYI